MLSRSVHVTSPQLKSPSFLGMSVIDNTFDVLPQLVAGGIKYHLRDSSDSNGRRLLEAYTWFSSISPHVPFPLLILLGVLLLEQTLAVNMTMLSTVIPLFESTNLGLVLRTLTQV